MKRGAKTNQLAFAARGFDKYYGTLTGAGSFYDPTRLARDNQLITPANDKVYQPKQFYYTDALSDQAVSFLQEHARDHQDKPFFMYVAYTAAHWPMHALPEDIAKYKGKYDGGYQPIREARYRRMQELGIVDPRWALSEQAEKWEDVPADQRAWEARCMEVYAAMIDRMDQGIGKIMSQLQSQGTLDNTLILFMQDNGGCAEPLGRTDVANWHLPGVEPMGVDELQRRITPPMRARDGKPLLGGPSVMPGDEHTYVAYGRGWANVSNTPLREYKHWVHEGGISTPLVAHWPRGITKEQQGKLFHEPGHLIDIAATCVDLARAKYPERGRNDTQLVALQGKTLLPAFQGRSLRRERPLFWEHEGNRAVRDGEWKLVAKGPKGKWELYNITKIVPSNTILRPHNPNELKRCARLGMNGRSPPMFCLGLGIKRTYRPARPVNASSTSAPVIP